MRSDQVEQARELLSAFERGELEGPDLPDDDDATVQTTSSHPYTFPSNPYTPSPAAVIKGHVVDRSSARPPRDKSGGANPELPAQPRPDKRARAPSGPLRKISLAIVGSVVVLALWLLFTH